MKSVVIISGWAHGIEAIQPMGDVLSDQFEVQLITGSQVLKEQYIPDADYIITGSMGGLLAMELLPVSCQKLVLISSTAKFCSAENYPCGTHEKILKRMILQLKRNPAAVLDEFFKNVHFPMRESRQAIASRNAAAFPLEELVSGLEYLLQSDVRSTVPTLGIPVQIFHGLEDRIIPAGAAEWLHHHLPNSQLKIYKGHGHALPAHQFGAVINSIRAFIA
ncbi:alpha/beta hydrolase [Pontiellaceae bacterium B12219]|nr:alpha/beta hydrolase [Pontiellaceae bacterium B12219]